MEVEEFLDHIRPFVLFLIGGIALRRSICEEITTFPSACRC